MQKTEFSSESWDKKKIIFAIFILIGLSLAGYGIKSYFLPSNETASKSIPSKSVEGVNTVDLNTGSLSLPSAQNIESGVAQNINNIKQEISNLNIADVASSSPQIQKIVNDIKSLPELPGQKAKDICLNICNGL